MRTQELKFSNGRGQMLCARLDQPLSAHARGVALFAHCFTCSKNLSAVVQVSRALVERQWAVMSFDFTGLGQSEGDFADTHFSSNVEDLLSAGAWLEQNLEAPKLLIGHSLGGAAVLRAAGSLASVKAVATLGAPCHPEHVTHLLRSERAEIESAGIAEVELAGRRFHIKKEFLDDVASQPMKESIQNLKRALLVMHAPKDQYVGIDNASDIFQSARHPKSFVSLDSADHLLTKKEDARYAASVISSWAERYLENPKELSRDASAEVVSYGPMRGFRTEVEIGEHRIIADEPQSVGGEGSGPTPYDLLQAALGTCTVMTLRMYAERKGWPLEQAIARMSHAKVHAKDCEDCELEEGASGRLDRIERSIEIRGADLSDEQRARLLQIADMCPVHRSLVHGPVAVVTKVYEGE